MIVPCVLQGRRPRAALRPGQDELPAPEVLGPDHPARPSLEAFIADMYRREHEARISHFAQFLVGLRRAGGAWLAGLGYTPADAGPLFIEHYLDSPAELEISARMRAQINRRQLVEVGNLAAGSPGAARYLIVRMALLLQRLERPWVVFTSTRHLLNSFNRLGVAPLLLARADPLRLPDRGLSWGTYYRNDPRVMTANIDHGLAQWSRRQAAACDPDRAS